MKGVVPTSNSPKRKSDELNGEAANGDAEVKTEEDITEEVKLFCKLMSFY